MENNTPDAITNTHGRGDGWTLPPLRVGIRADQLVREGLTYNQAMAKAWGEDKIKKAAKRQPNKKH